MFPLHKKQSTCEGKAMDTDRPIRVNDLHDVIDQRILDLVRDMETTNWTQDEVVLAINDVIRVRWLDNIEALHRASNAVGKDFVSDGNEG
jgi:hypothetical protein